MTKIIVRAIVLNSLRDLFFVSNFLCKLKIDDKYCYYTFSDHRNYINLWFLLIPDNYSGYLRLNKKGEIEQIQNPMLDSKPIIEVEDDTVVSAFLQR